MKDEPDFSPLTFVLDPLSFPPMTLPAFRGSAQPSEELGDSPETRQDDREKTKDALRDSPFLKACRCEPTEVTPIWLMRQAGRYMPEYRAIRSKVAFLDLCKRPDLCAEVTVTAAEKIGADAAILFADILLILEPLGFQLEFAKGDGPIIHNPIRTAADLDRVRPLEEIEPLGFVMDAVKAIRSALAPATPLIGFAALPSPWPATPSKGDPRAITIRRRPSCTITRKAGMPFWSGWLARPLFT